ncbi:Magnesium transport protein CorA- transmembrane region, partial [Apiospora aurea]
MATLRGLTSTEVEDDLADFFGTTEFNDRGCYFKESNPRWGTHEGSSQQATADNRLRVLNKIIKELERVERIRRAISKEPSERHLVECLEKSRQSWVGSEEYKEGIGKGLVNDWSGRKRHDTSPDLKFLEEVRSDLQRVTNSEPTFEVGFTHAFPPRSLELPRRIQRRPSETRVSRSQKSPTRLPTANERDEKAATAKPVEIEYDADEDFNAYLIQYERPSDNPNFEPSQMKALETKTRIAGSFPDQRIPIRHLLGEIEIKQPDENHQRATVEHRNKPSLPAGNLLKDPTPAANKIRYFHFPANNMAWAERAIALYYEDDEIPTSPGNQTKSKAARQSKIHTMLRPEYWRGQQQGDRGAPVHARHMRPLCETISLTTDDDTASRPKDVVLFMPFLHWETDRKRHTFASFVDTVTTNHNAEIDEFKRRSRGKAISDRKGLKKPVRFSQNVTDQEAPSQSSLMDLLSSLKKNLSHDQIPASESLQGETKPPVKGLDSFVDALNLKGHRLDIDEHRRVIARVPVKKDDQKKNQNRFGQYLSNAARLKFREPKGTSDQKDNQNRLGQYLIDAARLYEGITNYRDKKLLHKYLHVDPPIHPRRTLDQAYYWSLNTTQSRDRDQVVYRGTRAAVENLHQFDISQQVWPKHEEQKESWMSKHDDDGPCQECQANIRKISRLIMVDQLWLWVLDEHTILTFFPRIYGTNKNDVTGVHKSIRMRLEKVSKSRHPEQQMGSVWDLALIIFDECTNTFFDRTKTPDRQPQIIDDFSEAIGNVVSIDRIQYKTTSVTDHVKTNKQTIAFDRLWAWTEQWKANSSKKRKSRMSELHVSLLDINPEGKLQREIKDIIEELEIMIHINRTHRTILRGFIHQVIHIMDPNGQLKPRISLHTVNEEQTEGTGPNPRANNKGSRKPSDFVNEADYDRFETKAEELRGKVTSRIEELEELRRSAKSTSDSVRLIKDLLALKQQQASVVQAWQATQQTEETVAQGRSIMMFTVVTIVFAPLSFMTSVFGMNASEFSSENSLTVFEELRYILPVSAATILLVLFLAFNTYVRALVKAAYYRISANLMTMQAWGGYSVYKVWYANNSWRGEEQIDKAHTYARKKKRAAREEVLKERRDKNSQETGGAPTEEEQPGNSNGGSDGQGGGGGATTSTPQGNNDQWQGSDGVTANNGAAVPADAGKEPQTTE